MSVVLPASRHPALTALRWSLTLLFSVATVALVWAVLANLRPFATRPTIGVGCTGPAVDTTVESVRQAIEAWELTHDEPPASLAALVESGWIAERQLIPDGCGAPVIFEVAEASWSVRAPLR
jgi:hypothetical protein